MSQERETLLKVWTILGILGALIILYITGIAFIFDSHTPLNSILHHGAAFVIFLLFILHTWLRRCSVRRLSQEFMDILRNKQIKRDDNKSFIIQNTKNKSLIELASYFNWDLTYLEQNLPLYHIHIENTNDTLKEIAKKNDKDLYDIFLLITKLHIQKNTPNLAQNSFC